MTMRYGMLLIGGRGTVPRHGAASALLCRMFYIEHAPDRKKRDEMRTLQSNVMNYVKQDDIDNFLKAK